MNDSQPKRIMLTSYSGQMGGMELRMADEARQLARMGYDVMVAPSPFPGFEQLEKSLSEYGDRVFVAPYHVPPFFEEWQHHRINFLKACGMSADLMRTWKPDLVHVFFPWTNQGLSRLWLAAKRGIPAVVSVHNCFPKARFAPRVRKKLLEAFSTLRGVYGVSRTALQMFKDNFQEFIPARTLSWVIFNYVNLHRFHPDFICRREVRDRCNCDSQTFLIGATGRISEQKRPLELLEAFAEVEKGHRNVRLLFIGDGDLRNKLSTLSEHYGLSDKVKITGWVDPACYVPGLDLHVLASEREGFGIASIEALACGIPVLAVNSPGSSEILKGCRSARLTASEPSAMARAIVEYAECDGESSLLPKCARSFAEKNYSYERWQMQLRHFYSNVLEGHLGTGSEKY